MTVRKFYSFEQEANGQIITGHDWRFQVMFARNPYGGHNLVLIEDGKAFRHGDLACLVYLFEYFPRMYRRARRFLARKNRHLGLALSFIE
jgi:hypothetical protein